MDDVSEQEPDSKTPFLEWVFYKSVGIEREDKWMEWYDFHHYSMVQIPGWTWARMYRALIGNEKYLSLYRVEDKEALKQVYGWPDPEAGRTEIIEEQLHPTLRRDVGEKFERGFGDTAQFMFNGGAKKDTGHWGWCQLAGARLDDPLLTNNSPIGFELVSVSADEAEDWRGWVLEDRFPKLMMLPGVTMGGVFEIQTDGWEDEPRFRFAMLFELRNKSTVWEIGGSTGAIKEAIEFWNDGEAVKRYQDLESRLINYYEPISQHWTFKKTLWDHQ